MPEEGDGERSLWLWDCLQQQGRVPLTFFIVSPEIVTERNSGEADLDRVNSVREASETAGVLSRVLFTRKVHRCPSWALSATGHGCILVQKIDLEKDLKTSAIRNCLVWRS